LARSAGGPVDIPGGVIETAKRCDERVVKEITHDVEGVIFLQGVRLPVS
jgi:hypothetical protein